MWNVTPTTNWIIVFGGEERENTDTRVMELSKYMYTAVDTMCIEYEIVSIFHELLFKKYFEFEHFKIALFCGSTKI